MRAILLYTLYLGSIIFASTLLFRAIGVNTAAADAPVPVSAERAALSCEDMAQTLHKELWEWFFVDIRAVGPEPTSRGPLPGALREWESLRRMGEERCNSNKTREQFQHLLALRRALESQSYLLSTTAGADVAALR